MILTMLFAIAALAADTGTLLLQGTVAVSCNIVVTPNGTNNTTLDIVNGETNKLVATSNETCNASNGYIINVKSTNGGELRHTVTPTLKTTYQVNYGGNTVTPTTSYQQVKNVTVLTTPANVNTDVRVNVAAYANALAGTYEDTITIQIVANL